MTDNYDYDYEKYYLFVKEQEEYNKKSKYYIKILEDEKHDRYEVFYVNKNIPINKKMGKIMKNYKFLEFTDKFNKPLDNLPDNIIKLCLIYLA